jgi:hypothetical protein
MSLLKKKIKSSIFVATAFWFVHPFIISKKNFVTKMKNKYTLSGARFKLLMYSKRKTKIKVKIIKYNPCGKSDDNHLKKVDWIIISSK